MYTDEQKKKDLEFLDNSNVSLDDVLLWGQGGHWSSVDLDEFRCNHCGRCHELCFCEDGDDQ